MWKSMKNFKEEHPRLYDLLFYLIVLLAFATITPMIGLEPFYVLRFTLFSLVGMGIYFLRMYLKKK